MKIYFVIVMLLLFAGCSDSSNSNSAPTENTEGMCADSLDNDSDGAVDCDDVECLAFCGLEPLPEGTISGGLVIDENGRVRTPGTSVAEGWGEAIAPTYSNPVMPGDHPDMNLFVDGNDFYVLGSSFHMAPHVEILHSKDLVHWERISRVVRADWLQLNSVSHPGGGTWGGFIRKFGGYYWVYFAVNYGQYYARATRLEGPWEDPVKVNGDNGYDDSVFVDDDGSTYLLVKRNVCEDAYNALWTIGDDGQLTDPLIDVTFFADQMCPDWAEGPTMIKKDGVYYYFASTHTACGGTESAWRSSTLSDVESDWESLGTVLDAPAPFSGSQHSAAPIQLADGTWWTVYHSYDCSTWRGLGRQGLLSRVTWDANDVPAIDPAPLVATAPQLESGGIPWLKPVNDDFSAGVLGPHWTFYGYTPATRYSVTERPGWLRVKPDGAAPMYIVQKSVPHPSAMVARMEFVPEAAGQEAGIRTGTANNAIQVSMSRVFDSGDKIRFAYRENQFDVNAPAVNTIWLKMDQIEHSVTGWYSTDRISWTQVGEAFDVRDLDNFDTVGEEAGWVGNQSGVFATGKNADFDSFAYRDGFTLIPAGEPDNRKGTEILDGMILGDFQHTDWALYGSVDLGTEDADGVGIRASGVEVSAASASDGVSIQVWLNPLAGGQLAAICEIPNTGALDSFETVTCDMSAVGSHDVYLRVVGGDGELARIQSFRFIPARYAASAE
ncbi:MAG: family 43 glycosylhydrolase [Deltaproteobacteria bacterium]|nr:family 43 glycosylhydrolase [Deltaproteobacteria bacterium]MBN2670082.1 family 43 glycosylhydrolase [Deltaproteobacteria bacterium]